MGDKGDVHGGIQAVGGCPGDKGGWQRSTATGQCQP